MTLVGIKKKLAICWHSQKGLNDREIILYLVTFVVMVCALIFLSLIGAKDRSETWELASYAFPCLAGIAAGAGLFHRSNHTERKTRDKFFYSLSVLALFVGVLAYVSAHETCRYSSTVFLAVFFTWPTFWILLPRLITDPAKGLTSFFVYVTLGVLIVATIIAILGSMYVMPDLFSNWRCVDQAHH